MFLKTGKNFQTHFYYEGTLWTLALGNVMTDESERFFFEKILIIQLTYQGHSTTFLCKMSI